MKYLLLVGLIFGFLFPAKATHIVGGEFQMKHNAGSSYTFILNLYFDKVNGNAGAFDPSITVSIFEKGTNTRMQNFSMTFTRRTPVAYTSIACTNASLGTDKIVYTNPSVTLNENLYNSPNGYYVVWERCCRNNIIDNIILPGNAGQTFYLEFPAVTRNGNRFINSSPELFPPLSDYACLNELFYYDFGGSDPDGDSLVYEMITPLNGFSAPPPGNAMPLPSPGPYPIIKWAPGLNGNYQIPGGPSVSITRDTGRLTLRPTQLGLFVFGVLVSEYRNNIKIGEVRRDFQLLVLNCPTNAKPTIIVNQAGKNIPYKEGDVITIKANEGRCLNIAVTDTDPNEPLVLTTRPVNFSFQESIVAITQGIVNRNGIKDSLKTTACFPVCLDSQGKIFKMDFIVSDDGCSLPKKDTVQVSFIIESVPDTPPAITTTASSAVLQPKFNDIIQFDVTGTDTDNDLVRLSLTGENFDISKQAITFAPASGTGTATSRFSWKIDCAAVGQKSYILNFAVTSVVCGKSITRNTQIEVRPEYVNDPPTISSELAGKTIDLVFGTSIADTIYAADLNLDNISITAAGEDFNLLDYGMKFTPASGTGNAKSAFSWQPDCVAKDKMQYKVNFTVTESTCEPTAPKTISVVFNIKFEEVPDFIPANIFTPNDDNKNDYFVMPTLPPNFCNSVFSQIKIYNRWGKLVYQANDRDFKWDGKNVTDGVYFYHINYTDKEYKGTVTIVR